MKAPNATTRKAIAELEAGKGKKFSNVDALMAELPQPSPSHRRIGVAAGKFVVPDDVDSSNADIERLFSVAKPA